MSLKNKSYLFGFYCEYVAAFLFCLKGYRVLKHRYKTQYGEIDLIVKRGSLIVFVEVKGRIEEDRFDYAVLPKARRRIERTAQAFIQEHIKFMTCEMRFDVVFIKPFSFPKHIKRAWIFGD